jgi:tetratricopeptide (TPR) repeat protein
MNCASKAVAEIQEALQINPDSAVGYTNLVSHYAALNRLADAKEIYRRAAERQLDNPYLHLNRYGVAFLENDEGEMRRQLDWAAGKIQAEDLLLSAHSDTQAYRGQLKLARELSRRAAAAARSHQQNETAAEWEMNGALREAEFGDPALARKQAIAILADSSNRELQILGALVLARAGDAKRASRLADDLKKRFALDTEVNRYWLPCIHASLELRNENGAKAVEILQPALAYELGNPLPQAEIGGFLYPAYLRGESYLKLRRGQEAGLEFQKLLDHRGITLNGPLGALAQLGLARAFSLQRDPTKARAAYQDFLRLWKNADADIAVLKQAKAEYAKLK